MMTENAKVNILVAFPYFRKGLVEYLKRIPPESYRLIVDSGAFTAWNIGKQISMDEYCRFLDSIQFLRPFNAVQLDVFGNPAETWKNFLTMKRRGYDVMPVFTRGDSLERLDEMYSFTDYIMFGGITIGGKNINYVKWFMEQNKGRKVHWLGFTNSDFVKFFKPHSVDSSSWSAGARYGNIYFYKGFGQVQTISRKKLISMPEAKVFNMAKRSGITARDLSLLQDKRSWIYSSDVPNLVDPQKGTAAFFSMISTVHAAIEIEKNVGTKYYLALANEGQVEAIFAARNFLIERGIINGQHTGQQRSGPKVIRKRKDRLPDFLLT